MKRFLLLIFSLSIALKGFTLSDKIRLGFHCSPGIAWSKPFDKDLGKGLPRFGVKYGFTVEYWFAKNYGLTSGVEGAFDGCNLRDRDRFITTHSVNEKYAFHYLVLPAYIKLKTNDIKEGKFCVWGQVGFDVQFTVGARATYNDSIPTTSGEMISIEKENILKLKNDVTRAIPGFWANFFDIRLGVGGGFEYKLDKRSSLLIGLFYHNGFINNLVDHDVKKEPNVMRMISLRAGILF